MKRIAFVLGSNLGNKKSNLDQAIKFLEESLNLKQIKISDPLKNKALLKPNSPKEWDRDFLNIAISGDINLEKFPPLKILKIIHKIEAQLGRKRDGNSWAPRTIDIDIAFIEDLVFNENNLQIPHKELNNRDFFMIPLSEIEKKNLDLKQKNNQ